LQPFGAFIELLPGIDGLAHISELGAGRRISHPREVLNIGDKVEATVLSVDTEKRRIALSMNGDRQSQATSEDVRRHDQGSQQKPSFGTLGDLLKETLNKKES
jgi:small subunit ribosomal protein S1